MAEHTNKKYTYFVTGGGTGGHIYPAVAVGFALQKEDDTKKVFYVGNPNNLEKKIAEDKVFDFLGVNITAMPKTKSFEFLKWVFKLLLATSKSVFYILKHKPDLVFGTGGYVSSPMLFASLLTRTPIVIHECDAIPGKVSKLFAPYAKAVSVAFETSKDGLKSDNIQVNGNPIREEFLSTDRYNARKEWDLKDKLTIMVMGGSQGAKKLNMVLVQCLKKLFKKYDIQIIHQTGMKNYDETVQELKKVYPNYTENSQYVIRPYFKKMYLPMLASDIAVSRAGSLSISEICVSGLASILVPYPYAAADHQRKNAKEMETLNAALYLDDALCTPEALMEKLEELINNTQKMIEIQTNAKKLVKYDATKDIVNQIKEVSR
jgi:UDP-N-acetylglucosamine--N-acetylmuramyl-(pentapeptide) pyrophosphoryl-undecaprenol N-acetylglucosamine transferase